MFRRQAASKAQDDVGGPTCNRGIQNILEDILQKNFRLFARIPNMYNLYLL